MVFKEMNKNSLASSLSLLPMGGTLGFSIELNRNSLAPSPLFIPFAVMVPYKFRNLRFPGVVWISLFVLLVEYLIPESPVSKQVLYVRSRPQMVPAG